MHKVTGVFVFSLHAILVFITLVKKYRYTNLRVKTFRYNNYLEKTQELYFGLSSKTQKTRTKLKKIFNYP